MQSINEYSGTEKGTQYQIYPGEIRVSGTGAELTLVVSKQKELIKEVKWKDEGSVMVARHYTPLAPWLVGH